MSGGPVASYRHIDLTRVRLDVGNELGNRIGWHRRVYHHQTGHAYGACHRRDVADEIEIELIVESRVEGVGDCDREQRMAIRGRTHDRLSGHIAASARPVLDNALLT